MLALYTESMTFEQPAMHDLRQDLSHLYTCRRKIRNLRVWYAQTLLQLCDGTVEASHILHSCARCSWCHPDGPGDIAILPVIGNSGAVALRPCSIVRSSIASKTPSLELNLASSAWSAAQECVKHCQVHGGSNDHADCKG